MLLALPKLRPLLVPTQFAHRLSHHRSHIDPSIVSLCTCPAIPSVVYPVVPCIYPVYSAMLSACAFVSCLAVPPGFHLPGCLSCCTSTATLVSTYLLCHLSLSILTCATHPLSCRLPLSQLPCHLSTSRRAARPTTSRRSNVLSLVLLAAPCSFNYL